RIRRSVMSVAATVPTTTTSLPVSGLIGLLDQLSGIVLEIPSDVFCSPSDSHVSGTIGEHVRHSLDHIGALLQAGQANPFSYDHRQRGTAVELDPSAALQQMLRLKAGLERWSTRDLDEPIRVVSTVAAGQAVSGWSTLARELAFVISHTIHHQAIIGILLAVQGYSVPERFGRSPSTPSRH